MSDQTFGGPQRPDQETSYGQGAGAPQQPVSPEAGNQQPAQPVPPAQPTYETQQFAAQPQPQPQAPQAPQTPQTHFEEPAYQPRPIPKQKGSRWGVILGVIFGLIIGGAAVYGIMQLASGLETAHNIAEKDNNNTEQIAPAAPEKKSEEHSSAPSNITVKGDDHNLGEVVAQKALPSVVSIDTIIQRNGRVGAGVGSGVVLDKEGHIVTNHHVIRDATQIAVNVNGKSYEGKLVGDDPSSDLAVIKIDAKDLKPIELGDSSKLKIGQWVMAIGSPFGLEHSVSTGIVSSLYRSTTMQSRDGYAIYANLIQTDAAINPGNSGGALVDENGRLIGINTLIESNSGSSAGIGFAIPVNYVKRVADQIIAGKPVTHAFLGVTLDTVTPYNAGPNNLPVEYGAYVVSVIADGPAHKAGVKQGDIIIGVDKDRIASADDLILKVRSHEVGDKVKLTVMRGKEKMEIEATLGSDEASQHAKGLGQEQPPMRDQNQGRINPFDLYRYYNEMMGN